MKHERHLAWAKCDCTTIDLSKVVQSHFVQAEWPSYFIQEYIRYWYVNRCVHDNTKIYPLHFSCTAIIKKAMSATNIFPKVESNFSCC